MRSFRELVYRSDLPITLEAPLIRGRGELESFIESFKEYRLDRWVIGVNTVNNPMGKLSSDPIILGHLIQSGLGVEAIPHISVSVENPYTLARWLLGASLHNINNLLLLSGDIRFEGCLSFEEALKIVKAFSHGVVPLAGKVFEVEPRKFYLGGAIIPRRGDEHDRLLSKLKGGIEFFQTQIILRPERLMGILSSAAEALRVDAPIPILVSILPYLDERVVRIFGSVIRNIVGDAAVSSNSQYVSFVEGVLKRLLEFFDSSGVFRMGIHFIPIVWREESISNMCELIVRC